MNRIESDWADLMELGITIAKLPLATPAGNIHSMHKQQFQLEP